MADSTGNRKRKARRGLAGLVNPFRVLAQAAGQEAEQKSAGTGSGTGPVRENATDAVAGDAPVEASSDDDSARHVPESEMHTQYLPKQSHEELVRMAHRGRELRQERSQFLDQLRRRQRPSTDFAAMLAEARAPEQDVRLGKIRVLSFVQAIPAFGKVTASEFLSVGNIPPRKYLSRLTDAQVEYVVRGIYDILTEREIRRTYGATVFTLDEVVEILRKGTSGHTMCSLARTRFVIEQLLRTQKWTFHILDLAGVDVNSRVGDLSESEFTALVEHLTEFTAKRDARRARAAKRRAQVADRRAARAQAQDTSSGTDTFADDPSASDGGDKEIAGTNPFAAAVARKSEKASAEKTAKKDS